MESIVSRFEKIVEKYPDTLALDTPRVKLTYSDLNRQANRMADIILKTAAIRNERENVPVALIFTHSHQLVAATLGTLKARKIYAAINPVAYTRDWGHRGYLSDDRIRAFVGALRPCIALCDQGNWDLAVTACEGIVRVINTDLRLSAYEKNPGLEIRPEDKSVILHTSGTTGEPKAIVRDHEFEAYNQAVLNQPPALPGDRSTVFRFAGAGGFHDVLFALCNGATLCLFNLEEKEKLSDWAESITYWRSVGTVFRMLDRERVYPKMRVVNIGGEPITHADCERFMAQFPYAEFVNRYASSETGPITNNGRLLGDRSILILDGTNEIVVHSKYMAQGYFNDEQLTKEKFEDLGNGYRLYRTGDRGYLDADGRLVHQGRIT